MKISRTGLIVIAVLSVIIVVGIVYSFFIAPGESQESLPGNGSGANYDNLAKCLTEKNIKMYGAFWCSACNSQKKMFGESWKYVNYVECSTSDMKQTQECSDANIEYYPTWEFPDGERIEGAVPLENLAKLSGCEI